MLFNILLAFMVLVCVLMTAVILMQRSEGGALGVGGGTSGFMTARGAGNLLTRTTWVLGTLFFTCAVLLILEGNRERHNQDISKLRVSAPAVSALKAPPASSTAPAATAPAQNPVQAPVQALGQAPAAGAAKPATSSQPAAPDLGDLEGPTAKSGQPKGGASK